MITKEQKQEVQLQQDTLEKLTIKKKEEGSNQRAINMH